MGADPVLLRWILLSRQAVSEDLPVICLRADRTKLTPELEAKARPVQGVDMTLPNPKFKSAVGWEETIRVGRRKDRSNKEFSLGPTEAAVTAHASDAGPSERLTISTSVSGDGFGESNGTGGVQSQTCQAPDMLFLLLYWQGGFSLPSLARREILSRPRVKLILPRMDARPEIRRHARRRGGGGGKKEEKFESQENKNSQSYLISMILLLSECGSRRHAAASLELGFSSAQPPDAGGSP